MEGYVVEPPSVPPALKMGSFLSSQAIIINMGKKDLGTAKGATLIRTKTDVGHIRTLR